VAHARVTSVCVRREGVLGAAAGLMEHLRWPRAHLVGLSLGGARPDRPHPPLSPRAARVGGVAGGVVKATCHLSLPRLLLLL